MRHPAQFACFLLLASTAASAMSLQDAGENMLYFEHARLDADHCEGRGYRVSPTYEAWAAGHASLRSRVNNAIRQHAASGGLSTSEQEWVLKEAVEGQRKLARENIAKNGVNCRQFDAALKMYSSLLKR